MLGDSIQSFYSTTLHKFFRPPLSFHDHPTWWRTLWLLQSSKFKSFQFHLSKYFLSNLPLVILLVVNVNHSLPSAAFLSNIPFFRTSYCSRSHWFNYSCVGATSFIASKSVSICFANLQPFSLRVKLWVTLEPSSGSLSGQGSTSPNTVR